MTEVINGARSPTALQPSRSRPLTGQRGRFLVNQEVQTEASFIPSMVDLKYAYEPQACEQFSQLSQLRTMIQLCMQEVVGGVYDTVSFKDIMFKMEEEFPTKLPVTDMLLLSSKLFRTTSELGRLLGCFFGVVFADEQADEHFHFTELRILQRELREVKVRLQEADQEKTRLQQLLDNVGQVALDHGKAVELLENHNQALQLQTNALEDQMALLFRQLNTDLESNCKEAYDKVTLEMEMQERMHPTRSTFRQTMESLSTQIRSSRTLISEVRETLSSCAQGMRSGEAYLAVEPSVRFKLKMLDSNFQQLVGRFSSVKDIVVETAQELMGALHERKRILYLSYQHIRLYDLQNAKLRAGKAVLSELGTITNEMLRRMQSTFAFGAITSVDRVGRITTQRWHGGYTLAALRHRKVADAKNAAMGASSGDGAAGGPHMPPGLLPGLSEAQMMAAESELAAFEDQDSYGTSVSVMDGNAFVSAADSRATHASFVPDREMDVGAAAEDGDLGGTLTSRAFRQASNATQANSFKSYAGDGAANGAAPADLFDAAGKAHALPFTKIQEVFDLARVIEADISKLNGALTLEDEMSAFLRTLTLSVTSTARSDIAPDGTLLAPFAGGPGRAESDFERALHPTGGQSSHRRRSTHDPALDGYKSKQSSGSDSDSDLDSGSRKPRGTGSGGNSRDNSDKQQSGMSKNERAHAEALLARQAQQLQRKQEQLSKLQDDFSSKLGFLRQVYEARITDLEMKESTLKKKFTGGGSGAVSAEVTGGAEGSVSSGPDRPGTGGSTSLSIGRTASPPPSAGKKRAKGVPSREAEFALVRDMNAPKSKDEELQQLRGKTDREEILRARRDWRKSRETLESERRLREVTAIEIDRIEQKTEAKKVKKRADMMNDR